LKYSRNSRKSRIYSQSKTGLSCSFFFVVCFLSTFSCSVFCSFHISLFPCFLVVSLVLLAFSVSFSFLCFCFVFFSFLLFPLFFMFHFIFRFPYNVFMFVLMVLLWQFPCFAYCPAFSVFCPILLFSCSVIDCFPVRSRFASKNRKFHGSNLCFLNSSLIASFTASETLT
jgi:hypothetical protein